VVPEVNDVFNTKKLDSLNASGKASYDSVQQRIERIKGESQALVRFAENPQDELDGRLNQFIQERKAYSTKRLKELYDSMGISKLDTILAQLPIKHDVTEEELIQHLNQSLGLTQPNLTPNKEDLLA